MSHHTKTVVPDGGWGWVIVFCSFTIHIVAVGVLYAASVLYVAWLEAFNESKGYTSVILSLAAAVLFGAGPVPSVISKRFSNRVTVCIGGVVMFLGFLLSVFAQSVLHLIFSIGIVVGIGGSCCYLPSVSMVTLYFDKRRSIAMGISTSGLGVGTFVLPLCLDLIVETYGWRGCMLILSGLSLNMCVLGGLMRPLEIPTTNNSCSNSVVCDDHTESETENEFCQILCVEEIPNSNIIYQKGEGTDECMTFLPIQQEAKYCNCLDHDNQVSQHLLSTNHDELQKNGNIPIDKNRNLKSAEMNRKTATQEGTGSSFYDTNNLNSSTKSKNLVKTFNGSLPNLKQIDAELMEIQNDNRKKTMEGSLPNLPHSNSGYTSKHKQFSNSHKNVDRIKNSSSVLPLNNLQMMFTGNLYSMMHSSRMISSMHSLSKDQHNHQCSKINPHTGIAFTHKMKDVRFLRGDSKDLAPRSKALSISKKAVEACSGHFKLITNKTFMLFCVSNFLTNLSFFMPVLYMVDRAISEGISRSDATMLVSMYGAGNIFGKLFFGWLADRQWIGRLTIYCGCLLMAGATTGLSCLCGDNHILHASYALLYGCFIGSYCTTYPLVTVDLVGLDVVDESVGIVLFFMGVATALGSPLAGWIFDGSGSYSMAYVLHGLFIILSIIILIPLLINKYKKREQLKNIS